MYVTSYDGLARALDERRRQASEIRERVEAFVRSRYGISNLYARLYRFCDFLQADRPTAILARQIVSICAEDAAFEIGARRLGLSPVGYTFGRDAFARNNHDKVHRAKVPWVSWSKKGNLMLAYQWVCSDPIDALDGVPLDRIRTASGASLPEYHQALRPKAGLTATVADVFALDAHLLACATRPPPFVYREEGGREVRHVLGQGEAVLPRDRPPALWYYPYYLSWFLDGSMVLFETYENPAGEVGLAKKLFEEAMSAVIAATGFAPLVVKIPPLSKEMLYCNKHLLEKPAGMAELAEAAQKLPMDDTVSFFGTIAKSVIDFR